MNNLLIWSYAPYNFIQWNYLSKTSHPASSTTNRSLIYAHLPIVRFLIPWSVPTPNALIPTVIPFIKWYLLITWTNSFTKEQHQWIYWSKNQESIMDSWGRQSAMKSKKKKNLCVRHWNISTLIQLWKNFDLRIILSWVL